MSDDFSEHPDATLTRSDLEYLLERLDDATTQDTWEYSEIIVNGATIRIQEDS